MSASSTHQTQAMAGEGQRFRRADESGVRELAAPPAPALKRSRAAISKKHLKTFRPLVNPPSTSSRIASATICRMLLTPPFAIKRRKKLLLTLPLCASLIRSAGRIPHKDYEYGQQQRAVKTTVVGTSASSSASAISTSAGANQGHQQQNTPPQFVTAKATSVVPPRPLKRSNLDRIAINPSAGLMSSSNYRASSPSGSQFTLDEFELENWEDELREEVSFLEKLKLNKADDKWKCTSTNDAFIKSSEKRNFGGNYAHKGEATETSKKGIFQTAASYAGKVAGAAGTFQVVFAAIRQAVGSILSHAAAAQVPVPMNLWKTLFIFYREMGEDDWMYMPRIGFAALDTTVNRINRYYHTSETIFG
ncbi:unnamed protein product [Amoebophrya sp. A120]|nr:unnamed protein product [Amoebophrya sp. A120]|eukprot:GSA120T00020725001.1